MRQKIAVILSVTVLLAACGSGEQAGSPVPAPTSGAAVESPDDVFDRALDDLTRAFFFHSPELTTKFGISEVDVPRTAHRMKDRSPAGEEARREEISGTLARVKAIDPAIQVVVNGEVWVTQEHLDHPLEDGDAVVLMALLAGG